MKVLFVCYANVGLSPMAKAFYERFTGEPADAAGTFVDYPGQRLGARTTASGALASMRELGLDMGEYVRMQLTEQMLEEYDTVIVMSEPERTPAWLSASTKVEIWTVEDPRAKPPEKVRKIRDEIRKRVEKLAKQHGVKKKLRRKS